MSDADATPKEEHTQSRQDAQSKQDDTPGGMPAGPAPAIPDWYKVGWRQAGGLDATPLSEGEQQERGVLELFLKEQFYGDWYYNAALIIFVCRVPIPLFNTNVLNLSVFRRPYLHPILSPVSVLAGVGYLSSSPYVTHTIPPL